MSCYMKYLLQAGGLALVMMSCAPAWSDSKPATDSGQSDGQHPAVLYPGGGNDTSQQPGHQAPLAPDGGRQGAVDPGQSTSSSDSDEKSSKPVTNGNAPPTRHQAQ